MNSANNGCTDYVERNGNHPLQVAEFKPTKNIILFVKVLSFYKGTIFLYQWLCRVGNKTYMAPPGTASITAGHGCISMNNRHSSELFHSALIKYT